MGKKRQNVRTVRNAPHPVKHENSMKTRLGRRLPIDEASFILKNRRISELPMFKHVIWDWNGTLLDDTTACVEAINVLLERRGMRRISAEEYADVFDFPVRDYYVKLGFDFTREKWDLLAGEYHAVYAVTSAKAPLRTGAIAVLDALQAAGITLSVLSASELTLLKRMMAERGILGYFRHVYGLSDLYAHSKVELGHELLRTSGYREDESALVGDTLHDFQVAEAVGAACLLMTSGHQSESKLRLCGCPVVHTLAEARSWLEK